MIVFDHPLWRSGLPVPHMADHSVAGTGSSLTGIATKGAGCWEGVLRSALMRSAAGSGAGRELSFQRVNLPALIKQ